MNREFIKNLANQGAKKPTYQPKKQLLLWSIVMVFYAFLIFSFLGVRSDFLQKIHEPLFVLEMLVIFTTSFSAAIAASFLAIPDGIQRKFLKQIPFISLLFLCAIILAQYFLQKGLVIEEFCGESYKCTLAIFIFSIVPSAIFFVILYRAATLECLLAGFMIGLCGSSFSYLLLRLIHSTENIIHLFSWHLVPVFLVSCLSVILAKIIVREI